jgi:hypothetical protein
MLLAVGFFSLLIVAEIMPNPFPPLWEWINRERPIAADMEWQDRVGGRPATALAAGETIAIDAGRAAQVRRTNNEGELIAEWTADWLTVAGTGADAVVITGESLSRGYEVHDPGSGSKLFDDDDARAVWGFREFRMDLRCDSLRSCELRAYQARDQQPLWTTDLPGVDSSVVGVDPDLATTVVGVPARVDDRAAGPPARPQWIGMPIDRKRVAVIDSRTGEVMARLEPGNGELIMVVGDRVVRSVATRRDGVCVLSVTGHDLVTDTPVWGPYPYNLRTITGGGCDQRYAAVASGLALVAVDPEGHELVIDAGTGRVLWRGGPGDRVQGLTEELAIIKDGHDPTVRYALRLGGNGARSWERTVDAEAELMMAGCGVVVSDRDPHRIYVWDPHDGAELLSVRTAARVLACTADGLVLADGRNIGLAGFGGGSGAGERADSDPGAGTDPK